MLTASAVTSASMMGYERHKTKSKKRACSFGCVFCCKDGLQNAHDKSNLSKVLAVPAATSDSLKGYENKTRESDKK